MAACLLWVSVFLVGCVQLQKTAITESTLPTLKGKWSGWTTFSSFQSNRVRTTLEVNNDKVPVQGKIILHQLPGNVRVFLLIDLKDVSADNSYTYYFRNGAITGKGTLLGTNGQNFLELAYSTGEKDHRLDGQFYFNGGKGEITLSKD
jgi:hypothetical protein